VRLKRPNVNFTIHLRWKLNLLSSTFFLLILFESQMIYFISFDTSCTRLIYFMKLHAFNNILKNNNNFHHFQVSGMVSRVLGFLVCQYLTILDQSASVSGILSALADQSSAATPSSIASTGDSQPLLSLPNACLHVVSATIAVGAFDSQQYEQMQHLLRKLNEALSLADVSR
jgi:hypothetical protein